jgi:hypothetical protein
MAYSAIPDATTAHTMDRAVVVTSYCTAIGRFKANMPTKCIDHMPTPMARLPLTNQIIRWSKGMAIRNRAATSKEV